MSIAMRQGLATYLMVVAGVHQLLFTKTYANLYKRWGWASTGSVTPAGEAGFYGTTLIAVGIVLTLIEQDWGGLIVAGLGSLALMLLKHRAPRAWVPALPVVTLVLIIMGFLASLLLAW